jgi:hypothetical protein
MGAIIHLLSRRQACEVLNCNESRTLRGRSGKFHPMVIIFVPFTTWTKTFQEESIVVLDCSVDSYRRGLRILPDIAGILASITLSIKSLFRRTGHCLNLPRRRLSHGSIG